MLVARNQTMLDASAPALSAVDAQGLQGQALEMARQTVFHNFAQVKIEIPRDIEKAHFIHDQAVLSGLDLKYLELSAPLDTAVERGSTGQAYRFEDASTFIAKALRALNASAPQRNISPRLGIEVVAASASDFSAMLDNSHTKFCNALKADRLLVYLKVECLLRTEEDDARNLERFVESLEGHASLQCLVLADTCIDASRAMQMQSTFSQMPSLLKVDLSGCTVTQDAKAILRTVRSTQVILP